VIFRFLIFLFLFYLVYNLIRRMFPRPANGMAGTGRNGSRVKREGEVSIKYNPDDSKPSARQVGEYVDYEEVDD
jgi:hypothetical protein